MKKRISKYLFMLLMLFSLSFQTACTFYSYDTSTTSIKVDTSSSTSSSNNEENNTSSNNGSSSTPPSTGNNGTSTTPNTGGNQGSSNDPVTSSPLGFTNGYIMAIDYINTLLRLEDIIDFKQSKELSDYIQTALDKTLTSRNLK